MDPKSEPRLFLLAVTHTTRHLAPCVCTIAYQDVLPAAFIVTCDVDREDIVGVLDETWPRVARSLEDRGLSAPPLLHTSRAHQGNAMPAQVRNNGLRALDDAYDLRPDDRIVFLDGDTVLAPDALALHLEHARRGVDVSVVYRFDLTPEQTERLPLEVLLEPGRARAALADLPTEEQRAALEARHRRYAKRLRWKDLPVVGTLLVKPHMPKVVGGHMAMSVRALRAVNGFDEGYVGYAYEDDDISRRMHRARPRLLFDVAVRDIHVFHLWHETRGTGKIKEASGRARFTPDDHPVVAVHGWEDPAPQPPVRTRQVPDR